MGVNRASPGTPSVDRLLARLSEKGERMRLRLRIIRGGQKKEPRPKSWLFFWAEFYSTTQAAACVGMVLPRRLMRFCEST